MNQTYTVKAGDTLYGISNQFGVSVTELASLNNIKGSFLQIGQILKIPSSSGTNPNNMFMYTVKNGDNLYSIAKKYNTTVDEIKKLNYLTSNNLSIGQVLRIPEMYTPESEMFMPYYINYTVQKGDTIYSIAQKYNININTLMKDNSLTSENLTIGSTLRIRQPEKNQGEIEECFGEEYIPPESDNTIIYTVKKGDSLYKIANQYNTYVSNIINLNNLNSTNLAIGQKLKIPSNNVSQTYIVKSGDNLYSIAKSFNTTVNSLKQKNNLTSNLLSVGQKLII